MKRIMIASIRFPIFRHREGCLKQQLIVQLPSWNIIVTEQAVSSLLRCCVANVGKKNSWDDLDRVVGNKLFQGKTLPLSNEKMLLFYRYEKNYQTFP